MRLHILCVHIETSSLWAEFVNKNRCISVTQVSEKDKKHLILIILVIRIILYYDQIILLIFYVKNGSHIRLWHGCNIRLVFTLSPRDSTPQYKRCVHLWNNFPCIITIVPAVSGLYIRGTNIVKCSSINNFSASFRLLTFILELPLKHAFFNS